MYDSHIKILNDFICTLNVTDNMPTHSSDMSLSSVSDFVKGSLVMLHISRTLLNHKMQLQFSVSVLLQQIKAS